VTTVYIDPPIVSSGSQLQSLTLSHRGVSAPMYSDYGAFIAGVGTPSGAFSGQDPATAWALDGRGTFRVPFTVDVRVRVNWHLPCDPGYAECPGGFCRDLQDDPSSCGSCFFACPGMTNGYATCTAGVCGCITTPSPTNIQSCGQCGNVCPGLANGYPTCSGGVCGQACFPPYTLCGGRCVNTTTDNANCGTCGRQCATGSSCYNGGCCTARTWTVYPGHECGTESDGCGGTISRWCTGTGKKCFISGGWYYAGQQCQAGACVSKACGPDI
jgi:hypothetical protein